MSTLLNPLTFASVVRRVSVWMLLASVGLLLVSAPTAAEENLDADALLARLAEHRPRLHAQHLGYIRHLRAAGPSAAEQLNEILEALADGRSVLAARTGTFAWAVPIEMNGKAQPITIRYPDELQPAAAYPLIVCLSDGPVSGAGSQDKPEPHVTVEIDVHRSRCLAGPTARICLDVVAWAADNLPVDPHRVYLDASATDVEGALHLAALAGGRLAAVAMRTRIPRHRTPRGLPGLGILLVDGDGDGDILTAKAKLAAARLQRAGAIVERIAVNQDQENDDLFDVRKAVTAWLLSQGGKRTVWAPPGPADDPLLALFDGRPVRIVLPTGGDEPYRQAARTLAEAIARGETFEPADTPETRARGAGLGPHARLPMADDLDVAGEPVRGHWILIGSPSTNLVLADQIAYGPLRFSRDHVHLVGLDRAFSRDGFGFVLVRTNARDARFRVLIVASDNWRSFTTHAAGPLLPEAELASARRRPDLAVMHAETRSLAGMWVTDPFGRLRPSADARKMPLHLHTRIQLDRLQAEAARLATASDAAVSASAPRRMNDAVLDSDSVDLADLAALIGDQPILVTPLPAGKLAGVVRKAAASPTLAVLPHDPFIDGKPRRVYRVAVPMGQFDEVIRQVPEFLTESDPQLAAQGLAAGLEKFFGRPGDLNRDGVIDRDDFVLFKRCLTGAMGTVGRGCRLADLNGNDAIEDDDFQRMRRAWSETDADAAFANHLMTAEDLEDWLAGQEY